jgi:hypothetical protein
MAFFEEQSCGPSIFDLASSVPAQRAGMHASGATDMKLNDEYMLERNCLICQMWA